MAVFKCKMCGGSLEIAEGTTVCECEYCGTQQTLPKNHDDVLTNLFNRANNLRMKSEFDKAQEIYEKIVGNNPTESEAYWGIVLCKYGIEYVEDPATLAKVPTCHRTQLESVMTDVDYQAALEHSDLIQRGVYEREAAAIDKLQKDILAIVHKEQPFDVFICYKETDENGRRTQDSVIANDIYHQLTQEGFKVFFAAITLEDKLGQEYEPYIFAALNSAKVMLCIGTKPEYFNAVWVKNEWSRYIKLMKSDRSKLLIPCYKDMDAYDLPEEFSHLQAQDMGKIGFINDVIRGIKKVLVKDEPKPAAAPVQTVVQKSSGNIENLLKRGFLSLEDQKWDEANRFFEDVLNENVEEPRAYIGKLCAEKNVTSEKALSSLQADFSDSDNYKKACRFGGKEAESRLHGYILQGLYDKAEGMLKTARTVEDFNKTKELFVLLGKYKDMSKQIAACEEKAEKQRIEDENKAEELRKERIYKDADVDIETASKNRLEYAIEVFGKIRGYRDVDDKISKCKTRIKELDEIEKNNTELAQYKRKQKKRIAVYFCVITVAIIVVTISGKYIKITIDYRKAESLFEKGLYKEAYEKYKGLKDYKDSAEQLKITKIYISNVNDIVSFGNYQWYVISKDKDTITMLCEDVICQKAYYQDIKELETAIKFIRDTNITEDTMWEKSSLRKWLNTDFYSYFSEQEKSLITISYSGNNNDIQDYVFILNTNEAENVDQQILASSSSWWLRTKYQYFPEFKTNVIYSDGSLGSNGNVVNQELGVRPALTIKIE